MPTLRINKNATYKYELLDKYEAGIELEGWEVPALKKGQVDFQGSYIKPIGSELYWINATVTPTGYSHEEHEIARSRRLLLRREQIDKLTHALSAKRLTIIPVRLYTTRSLIKLEIAVARGKKHHEQNLEKKRKSQEQKQKQELKDSGY